MFAITRDACNNKKMRKILTMKRLEQKIAANKTKQKIVELNNVNAPNAPVRDSAHTGSGGSTVVVRVILLAYTAVTWF